MARPPSLGPAHEYLLDAWQRSILFLDVLRQRGNIYREQQEDRSQRPRVRSRAGAGRPEAAAPGQLWPGPHHAPEGVKTDPAKRPFVVVDPRAGHGPGIGGMKQDSEIGVALEAAIPCYFIGFLPEPMPGQTIEDVWNAEAEFLAKWRAGIPRPRASRW